MPNQPTKEGLLKLLERNGLQQLITQLNNYPEVIEDWQKRSESQWKEFYGFAGIDIYNYLHPSTAPPIQEFNASQGMNQYANLPFQEYISPQKVVKELLGFGGSDSEVNFKRPSVTLESNPTQDLTYIVPWMKFVCRENPTKYLYETLDEYLNWKASKTGEFEKQIKFVTVVGTAGKGKTTFARRFLDLEYSGQHKQIVSDCRKCNRRYRVSCASFDLSRDAETQLSLLVLFEAFKYSIEHKMDSDTFLNSFYTTFYHKILFQNAMQLIYETFYDKDSPALEKRLVIINLDETNDVLYNEAAKSFLKSVFRILRNTARRFNILTILSGTHSVELFQQVKISSCYMVDIALPLIDLESAKQVILGMCSSPNSLEISPHLEYLLTLCGGVGRYLEIAIIQMSIMGSASMDGTVITGFKLDAYNYFLKNMQTPVVIESLLRKVCHGVLMRYPEVFSRFSPCIELLSCYTIFQWPVNRYDIIRDISMGDLEKEGLVFLEPVQGRAGVFTCVIPFITLYWAIENSNIPIQIPFLKKLDSFCSSDEAENNSLHILMLKLWGLYHKNGCVVDANGFASVMLSELFPLRPRQLDTQVTFRPVFKIMTYPRKDFSNYQEFIRDNESQCIAFSNAKESSVAMILSHPVIGIVQCESEEYESTRATFPSDGILVLITDKKEFQTTLNEHDVFIEYAKLSASAGPLIALKRLFCQNDLNLTNP